MVSKLTEIISWKKKISGWWRVLMFSVWRVSASVCHYKTWWFLHQRWLSWLPSLVWWFNGSVQGTESKEKGERSRSFTEVGFCLPYSYGTLLCYLRYAYFYEVVVISVLILINIFVTENFSILCRIQFMICVMSFICYDMWIRFCIVL